MAILHTFAVTGPICLHPLGTGPGSRSRSHGEIGSEQDAVASGPRRGMVLRRAYWRAVLVARLDGEENRGAGPDRARVRLLLHRGCAHARIPPQLTTEAHGRAHRVRRYA